MSAHSRWLHGSQDSAGEAGTPPLGAPVDRFDDLAGAVTLGAFRGCDAHLRQCGLTYRAVMEWTGPDAVLAILRTAEREGIWCSLRNDEDYDHGHCYAVLDLIDVDDEATSGRCIPTREAWDWWVRAVELRATSADCPVDEPAAFAMTYPGASS